VKLLNRRAAIHYTLEDNGQKLYLTVGKMPNGKIREIFLNANKGEGSFTAGMMRAFAITLSKGLSEGIPLEEFQGVFDFPMAPNFLVMIGQVLKDEQANDK
jgi:hypothetical protein